MGIIIDLDWPYRRQTDVFEGINRFAAGNDNWKASVLPFAEGGPSGEGRLAGAGELPFDGIIARADGRLAERSQAQGIVLVNIWVNSPVADQLVTVAPDYREIGRRCGRHLLGRGLRRFGYLGFERDKACRRQYEGLREVVSRAGCAAPRFLARRTYNRDAARWAEFQGRLGEWIGSLSPPVGIAATDDLMGRYVAELCSHLSLRVPEDVAIVGTGDDLPICLHPEPALSSVDCGYVQAGYRAAELLDEMMRRGRGDAVSEMLDNARLVARHSTDAFAVDDPIIGAALRFISEHCDQPINVSDVVGQVGASRRSLERKFSQVLGQSIGQEISRMRIRRLERLLVESTEPLEEVSRRCGFSDADQMRANFVRILGMTPSEYRRQHRG